MIQYFINKLIELTDELVYALKASVADYIPGTVLTGEVIIEMIPEERKFNSLNQTNTPIILNTDGEYEDGYFDAFTDTRINGLTDDYAVNHINFNFQKTTQSFLFISPEDDVNGYSTVIVKSTGITDLINYKGKSKSIYVLPKGDTAEDVRFVVLRLSPTEVLFISDIKSYTFESYFGVAGMPSHTLDNESRSFKDIPAVGLYSLLLPQYPYAFRMRGQDEFGNYTEWSTEYVDQTDAFILPIYDQEDSTLFNDLTKVRLTNSVVGITTYPTFESGLQMVSITYNETEKIIRSGAIKELYMTNIDDRNYTVKTIIESRRFNTESSEYANFRQLVDTTDVEYREYIENLALRNEPLPSAAVDVSITRMSDTTYLVEAIGTETSANLKFKKESDGTIDDKGLQSLPYTYTHSSGEVWEVSGDGGANYVTAWAIDIPLGAYLEAQNASDLDWNDYMEISLLIDPQTDIMNHSAVFFGKVRWTNDNARWAVYARSGSGGAVVLFSRSGGSQYIFDGGGDAPLYNKWYNIKSELDGVNYSITLNDLKLTDTIDLNVIPYTSTNFFRIGKAYYSILDDRFIGKVQSYKHGIEVFSMQEGSGTTTIGSEGTVLNLLDGATWVKI